MNKVDLFRQERCQAKFLADRQLGGFDPGVDRFDGRLQRADVALFIPHHPLPVPLVDIDGVDRRKTVFIGAKGLHVRVQPFARAEVVLSQGLTLPFRQRMNHFELGVGQCFHFYLNRFLAAGQVILRPIAHAA